MNFTLLKNIKTPTTVEEFRNNLKLYFEGDGKGLYCRYSKFLNDLSKGENTFVPYNVLSEIGDLYEILDVPTVGIVPLINYDQKVCFEYLERNPSNLFFGYFNDEYEVYTDFNLIKKPHWIDISWDIFSEFFNKVWGPFGYCYFTDEQIKKGLVYEI